MNFNRLTEYLDSLADQFPSGSDCIICYKHTPVYRHACGYWDYQFKTPVKHNSTYFMYSATKPVTCTAALTLYEKGKFLLSDPLYEYIPEFKDMMVKKYENDGSFHVEKAENPIRIVDLFTMSAGFSYNTNCEAIQKTRAATNGKCPTLSVIRSLASETLEFEPGTQFMYSLCHDILGGLIEIISGKTLGKYLEESIFNPIGMTDTSFELTEEKKERMAAQYSYNPLTNEIEEIEKSCRFQFGTEYESGGAGLVSTVSDFSAFGECLCNNGITRHNENIISKATIDLMRTNHLDQKRILNFRQNNLPHRIGYGYGLGVRTMISPTNGGINGSIGEFGWPGAAGSYMLIDPDKELTVFFAQHCLCMDILWKIHPRIRNIVYSCLEKI